jgi:hypothetical protein
MVPGSYINVSIARIPNYGMKEILLEKLRPKFSLMVLPLGSFRVRFGLGVR